MIKHLILTFILFSCVHLGNAQNVSKSQSSVIRIPKGAGTKKTEVFTKPESKVAEIKTEIPKKQTPIKSLNFGPSLYLPGSILSAFGNSVGYGANIDSDIARIYENLNVYAEASVMHSSRTESYGSQNLTEKINSNFLPIMTGIRYHLTDQLPLYLGVGLGYTFLNINYTTGYGSSSSETINGFGYNLHVGFDFPKFSVQVKHMNFSVGDKDVKLPISNFAITAHYRIFK